ncbi:hypothetical protein SPD94_19040, partial [Escherichia coli]
KRVFLVILFTSFSGSLVSRIPGAVHTGGNQCQNSSRQAVSDFYVHGYLSGFIGFKSPDMLNLTSPVMGTGGRRMSI